MININSQNRVKILPTNLQPGVRSTCGLYYRLISIRAHDDIFKEWFLERFNMIKMDEYYNITFDFSDTDVDSVFFQQKVVNTENIINTIIELINNNGYIILKIDLSYITSLYHRKEEATHIILIFGYDLNKMVFYATDLKLVARDGKLSRELLISDVEKGFYSGLNIIKSANFEKRAHYFFRTHFPLITLYLKKDQSKQDLNLNVIFNSITEYLNGGKSVDAKYLDLLNSLNQKENGNICTPYKRVGISVYEGFYNDLFLKIMDHSLNENMLEKYKYALYSLKVINESKQIMKMRLNYLENKGTIKCENKIYEDIGKLCESNSQALSLVTKGCMTSSKKYVKKAIEIMTQNEQLDRTISTEIQYIFMKLADNIITNMVVL